MIEKNQPLVYWYKKALQNEDNYVLSVTNNDITMPVCVLSIINFVFPVIEVFRYISIHTIPVTIAAAHYAYGDSLFLRTTSFAHQFPGRTAADNNGQE